MRVSNTCTRLAATAIFCFATASASVQAATVYTGDTIQGKRVISQLDVSDLEAGKKVSTIQRDAMIEPGTRVMHVLHDSPDAACDGDGCGEESADYVE